MILAAGRGQRMRPLTDTLPKPLLQVNSKPLIVYHLEKLAAFGIKHVVINLAWLGHKLKQELGCGMTWGLTIQYIDEGSRALETAGGIKNALPYLKSEYFLVVNGDIWTDFDFAQLPTALAPNSLAYLVMVNNPNHNIDGDFSLIDGQLHDTGDNKKTFSGIGLYHKALFDLVEQEVSPLGPILRQAMANNLVQGQCYQGQWTDVGTPQRLEQLEQQLIINNKGFA